MWGGGDAGAWETSEEERLAQARQQMGGGGRREGHLGSAWTGISVWRGVRASKAWRSFPAFPCLCLTRVMGGWDRGHLGAKSPGQLAGGQVLCGTCILAASNTLGEDSNVCGGSRWGRQQIWRPGQCKGPAAVQERASRGLRGLCGKSYAQFTDYILHPDFTSNQGPSCLVGFLIVEPKSELVMEAADF